MQDKQIREQINSLDTLPEGYAPSLESKWELLQAGKPVKKQKQPFFWYAAAASFLMLLGLGFLFLKQERSGEAPSLARQEISAPNPAIVISGNTSFKKGAQNLPTEVAKVENPAKAVAKNGMISGQKADITTEPIIAKASIIDEAKNTETVIQIPETQPVQIASAKPEKSRKRHKFVEVDFDAPAAPMRQQQPVQTAQIQFKLKFLPKPSEAAPAVVQQENPLRLQHTF